MALITTPGTTANSYASLIQAETYFGSRDDVDAWDEADNALREEHLKEATRLLDRLSWCGEKQLQTNSLRWPRAGVFDRDDYELESDTIPMFLMEATCELALHLAGRVATGDDTGRVKSLTLGSALKIEMDDETSIDKADIPRKVQQMIRYYLRNEGAMLVRG